MSASLTPRHWDSMFFGFSVAEMNGHGIDDQCLAEVLLAAQRDRVDLVYWRADPRRKVSQGLLDRFAGQLVDRRIKYRLSLSKSDVGCAGDACQTVSERAAGPATPDLVELAIAAGQFSRFKVDRRFPAELFEALYRTWIDRSARHEIADAVLVAPTGDAGISGLATISFDGESGTIGLISVREAERGRGIGRALMAASHRWMADHGLHQSYVTTQECNKAACALYERCGYRVAERSLIYHFWPIK